MSTNKKKVMVVEWMAPAALALLNERADIETVEFPNYMPEAEFVALVKKQAPVHGFALGATPFGEAEAGAAADLRVVGRVGVGYDSIDVPAMNKRKIPLMTTGIANSPSVAEAALFMMLALAKRGAELDALVRNRRWKERTTHVPFDLLGKTALVVGFGRIGTRLVKRLVAMEMNVLVYDPFKSESDIKAAGAKYVKDLDAALPDVDFLSLNCPRNPSTMNMFDAARLQRMKKGSYFINTARGGLVDEPALYDALTSGRIAGAGLDVFLQEPPQHDNPLLTLDNVITAPHIAGVTKEALERMGIQTIRNILSVLDGSPNRENCVNPETLN